MIDYTAPEPGAPIDATAVILCYNEAIHLDRCLSRIAPYVKRVVLVDSFSTDATLAIGRRHGADILQRKFTSHAEQFNWGMQTAAIDTGWTIRLDSDEYLDAATVEELRRRLPLDGADVAGYGIRRRVIFKQKVIRYGGFGKVVLSRVWRTGQAEIEQRWMDEHVLIRGGETRQLEDGYFYDENLNDIHWWTEKHNGYATRQMIQYILWEFGTNSDAFSTEMNADARRKRALRERFYLPLPLYLRAILYFLFRYIGLRGFLDGRRGFAFHALQGLWNFFLVDAKVAEARAIVRDRGFDGFKAWIREHHGMAIDGEDALT